MVFVGIEVQVEGISHPNTQVLSFIRHPKLSTT